MTRQTFNMKINIYFISILILLFFCGQADADNGKWHFYKRASISSKTHGSLNFEYMPGQGVKIYFYIYNNSVSFKNNLPLYRVDDGKIHKLNKVRSLRTGKKHWIRWTLTDKNKISSPRLEEIANGKKLYFQYYLPGHIIKEAVFDLTGIRKALDEITR